MTMMILTIAALLAALLTPPAQQPGRNGLPEPWNRVGIVVMSQLLINDYLAEVQRVHATGVATEHAYRPALEKLFKSIADDVTAINEPKGNIRVGRPDFVFLRNLGKGADLTVGHCEAKDIGLGINPKGMNDFNKAQHERYVKALPNLIYTNGLDFRFYKEGELTREISIADFLMGIQPKPDQFSALANQLRDFCAERLQTITSAEKLAEMMAGKAVLIKDILFNSLKEDVDLQTELVGQYQSFKKMLIHDLSAEDFADIYAETIAYGMFGARLHDKTLKDFSRAEALELMPKSNPFLRYLFTYIAGPNLDDRIRRTIDELAEIFQATDLPKLFQDFGKFTQRNDPFVHFYETFLAAYNPAKRKARGVWYTPEPVVNFIVRAVDDVLKTEFGLADGLADTSKVTIDWDSGETKNGKPVMIKKEVHRVQILDPAAGTGTFLAEVIKQIAPRVKDVAEGQWSNYVEKDLIPRIHGFELLMASYAMCHMKLDMMLTDMGYKPTANPPRMGVYLTNSLEEGEREIQDLFWAKPLSEEAKHANTVKRDMPIMCVIGNPPYSGISTNVGSGFQWINGLLDDYKKEPGGKKKLEERKHWLDDDYVKFLRFGEHLVEKNRSGILAMITNHGYLSNPTFRGMRWHILKTFDKVFIFDLHGNSKKGEAIPEGLVDENVFDIQQGVAVVVAVKSAKTSFGQRTEELANLRHADVWGRRYEKYEALWKRELKSAQPLEFASDDKHYFFTPVNLGLQSRYEEGFSLSCLLPINSSGCVTAKDAINYGFDRLDIEKKIAFLKDAADSEVRLQFGLKAKDARDWKVQTAKRDATKNAKEGCFVTCLYRPFDFRHTCYTGTSRGLYASPQARVMRQLMHKGNFALTASKVNRQKSLGYYFIADRLVDFHVHDSAGDSTSAFPLYIYPDEQSLDQTRRVNFDPKIHKTIIAAVVGGGVLVKHSLPPSGRTPSSLRDKGENVVPDEVAIFDYIYGVLHCPVYRETYKEFLKIDFPRVPYPPSPDVFWDVSAKGTQLRQLHLMEEAAIGATPYKFTGQGDSIVGKLRYEGGRVNINDAQGFDGVPDIAWNFYIGGYQPAQKWLKDRKGRSLSFEDIRHYQKIIKILSETDRIMKTIEMPL